MDSRTGELRMTPEEMHAQVLQRTTRIEARARALFARGGITWEDALQIEAAAENEETFENRVPGGSIYILRGSSSGPKEAWL